MSLTPNVKTYNQSLIGNFHSFSHAFENARKNPRSVLIYKGNESAKSVLDVLLPVLPDSCETVTIINLDDSIEPDNSLDATSYGSGIKIITDSTAVTNTTFDWIISFYGYLWNVKTKDTIPLLRNKLKMKGKGSIILETKGYIPTVLQKISQEPKWAPYTERLLDGMLLYDSDLARKDDLRHTFREVDYNKTTITNHESWYEFTSYNHFKGYINIQFKQLKSLFETEEGYNDLIDDILKEMKKSSNDILVTMVDDVYANIKVPVRNTAFLFSTV